MNLSQRHQSQVNSMIGKKVRVYMSFRKVERVLREDRNGLYIRLTNQRVTVRPDTTTLNILHFLAIEPKQKAIEINVFTEEEQQSDQEKETAMQTIMTRGSNTVTTANGTIQLDVHTDIPLFQAEHIINNDTLEMSQLLIQRVCGSSVILSVQSHNVGWDDGVSKGNNTYGRVTFNVSSDLHCSPDELNMAANYLLYEWNIEMGSLLIELVNGGLVEVNVNAVWIDWNVNPTEYAA